jgi:hypothetical protein
MKKQVAQSTAQKPVPQTGIIITFSVTDFPEALHFPTQEPRREDPFSSFRQSRHHHPGTAFGRSHHDPFSVAAGHSDHDPFGAAFEHSHHDPFGAAFEHSQHDPFDDSKEPETVFNQAYSKMLAYHAAILASEAMIRGNVNGPLHIELDISSNLICQANQIACTITGCSPDLLQGVAIESDLLRVTAVQALEASSTSHIEQSQKTVRRYEYNGLGQRTKASADIPATALPKFMDGEQKNFLTEYKNCIALLADDHHGMVSIFRPGGPENSIGFFNERPLQGCGKFKFFKNTAYAQSCFKIVPLKEKKHAAAAMLTAAYSKLDIGECRIRKNKNIKKAWIQGLSEEQAGTLNDLLQESFPGTRFKQKVAGMDLFIIIVDYNALALRDMAAFAETHGHATCAASAGGGGSARP